MLGDMKVSVTVDAAGDGTGEPDWWPGPCYVEAVVLDFGDLALNMDISIAAVIAGGVSETFFTKANQGAADAIWHPRQKKHDGADASALADADGNAYGRYLLMGKPTVTIADGGVSKSGVVYIIVDIPKR